MRDDLRQHVRQTVVDVLGTMFFTFPEPMEPPPPEPEWGESSVFINSTIAHTGQIQARYNFYFPERLARTITQNFLGVEANEVTSQQVLDTMAEIANMIAGSLLGRIDPDGASKLSIPAACELPGFTPASVAAAPGVCVFQCDEGVLWLVYEEEG